MALTNLQRTAYRLFGARAAKSKQLEKLADQLRKAHMEVRAEAYLSYVWLISFVCAGVGAVLMLLAAFLMLAVLHVSALYAVLLIVLPAIFYFTANLALMATPGSAARKRAKDIDAKLPYATNYITAMASAGVIPTTIFRSLARQSVYGECARESAWIYKDLEFHGKDVVTALHRAIDRTPSEKFKDLLQGAITTITSGGDLTAYMKQKAQRLQFENRQVQQSFIETMGLMAESYVTAAVAGPLFLLVMVAIFVLTGSGEMSLLASVVYLLMPVANGGFMFAIYNMIPEV